MRTQRDEPVVVQENGHGHDEEEGSCKVAMRPAAAAGVGDTGHAHPDESDWPGWGSDPGWGERGTDQSDGRQAPGERM